MISIGPGIYESSQPRCIFLSLSAEKWHAPCGFVHDVFAAFVPGHIEALPNPLIVTICASCHDEEAEPGELRCDPPMQANSLRPFALPGVGCPVHDDAVQGGLIFAKS